MSRHVCSWHLAVQQVAPDLRRVALAEQLRLHRHPAAAAARAAPRRVHLHHKLLEMLQRSDICGVVTKCNLYSAMQLENRSSRHPVDSSFNQ